MKRVALLASILLASTILTPVSVLAHPSQSAGGSISVSPIGNDISWPQCGKNFPTKQAFGIVGVNDGLANTTNPCFNTELSWANSSLGNTAQPKAALYVNTANPGNLSGIADWPTTGSTPYGICSGQDNQACAWQYGWNMAAADATTRISGNNPSSFMWWLDVETNNSWEPNTTNNTADLEGMVAYFQNMSARVGLYSTSYQWKKIAGSVPISSNLYGLNSWLPGASSLTAARANCSISALTGGKVALTQYVSRQVDYDYSCI